MADNDDAIWSSTECAEYFGYSRKRFLRHFPHKEGFPKPLPWSEGGRPRWAAKDVKNWALLRQDYAKAA